MTCSSIETLGRMLYVPAAASDIIKADLVGLVLQILQGPFLKPFCVTAANSLYFFSCQPAVRQQLVEKLTPDSAKAVIELCLKLLEAPDDDHAALVIAAGDILYSLLPCSCSMMSSRVGKPVHGFSYRWVT